MRSYRCEQVLGMVGSSAGEEQEPLAPEALRHGGAVLPLVHRRMAGAAHRPGDLGSGQAITRPEGPQPLAELQPVAAEAMCLRPAVAAPPRAVKHGDGDHQFPAAVMRHYGICRRISSGLEVSALGLGCMGLSSGYGPPTGRRRSG